MRLRYRHHLRPRCRVGGDFGIDDGLDPAHLLIVHRRVVGKVKTRLVAIHERTLLLHMIAQHLAQGLVHQVGGRVVAHGARALRGVDCGANRVPDPEHAGLDLPMVAENIRHDFLRVSNNKARAPGADDTLVANLSARLRIKRRLVENHHDIRPGLGFFHRDTIDIQSGDVTAL